MRALLNVVGKEARELFTPQALAPLLIVVAIYTVIGRAIHSERAKQEGAQPVLVVDRDESGFASAVRGALEQSGFIIIEAGPDTDAALALARDEAISLVVVLPEGLGAAVAGNEPAEVEVYGVSRGFSMTEMVRGERVQALLRALNDDILRGRLHLVWPDADPERLLQPLDIRQFVSVRGRVAEGSPALLGQLVLSQTMMIPIILLMVIIIASQMIAASVGQEKENKTLETLLTVPVSRVTLVLGKMLGAALFALVSSGIFIVAMASFMRGLGADAGPGGARLMAELSLQLGGSDWVLLGLGLFLAVLCALALVSVLAIFADDARSAQLATTPVMVLVMIPYFLTMFFDVQSASATVRALVYAQPFAYPFLMPRALMFEDHFTVWFGLGYMTAFAVVMVFIAVRLYSGDRILTARLSLRRR